MILRKFFFVGTCSAFAAACSQGPTFEPGTGGTTGTSGGAANNTGGAAPGNGGAATSGGAGPSGGAPLVSGGSASGGQLTTGGASSGGSNVGGGAPAGGATPSDGGSGSGGGPPATFACGLPDAGTPGTAKPSGAVGGLTVINWAGFKAAISYTFDDTNSSQISNYTKLNDLGVPLTFYLQTNKSAEIGNQVWATARDDGHELGNHSHTHTSNPPLSDLQQANMIIEQNFDVTPLTMAAPNGTNPTQAPNLFFINRGVNAGTVAPKSNADLFNLPCYLPPTGASTDTMNAAVNAAYNGGAWTTYLVHGFTGGSDGAYQPVGINEFVAHVENTKDRGAGDPAQSMWIDTVLAVGSYFVGQKVISAATPVASGDSSTYSWDLPAHFPTDRCVRVTVTGGNVTQDGKALPWNDRGYYEVSLDAGSLTVGP